MTVIRSPNIHSILLGSLPLLLAVTAGCQQAAPASTPELPSAEASAIRTARPQRRALRRVVEQPGQIEGYEQTALAARIAGYVARLNVDIGDRVKKDDVLAVLSVPEVEEELRLKQAAAVQAKAEVTLAKRVLDAAEAAVARADANLKLTEAGRTRAEASYIRWQAEAERQRVLVRRQAGDQQTLEQATDSLRSAEAARAENEAAILAAQATRAESAAQRDKAAADIVVAEARQQVAEADRDRTAANLAYAQIKAPFDGVVSRRLVDTGAFVQPAGGAAVLFTVVRTDPVRLFVDVPEAEAALVREGLAARVRVQALDDQDVKGAVTRSSWSLDGQARTLRTQIDLPNADGRLRPGMYASARLEVEHPGVLTAPASAVWVQDDQPTVLRLADGRWRRTPVKVGLRQGGFVQLLKKQAPAAPGERPAWEDFTGDEELAVDNPAAIPDGGELRSAR
jgi:multidrug efflux pump subunit AcrA (membrane-fusion protein)